MADTAEQAIADFAQHLIPEGFTVPSTAYRVELLPLPARPTAFAEWIERCRQDAAAARYGGGGSPAGVVFVRRGDERWRWDLSSAEDLAALSRRINDEISTFAEPWVFVSSLRLRDRALQAAGEATPLDALQWTQPWYAEARGSGVARVYTGLATLQGSEVMSREPLAADTPFERAARRILSRHPSRRRYRLR